MTAFRYQLLDPRATLTKGTRHSAGWDLRALEGGWVWPLQTRHFRTGLALELPVDTFGHITSRSSGYRDGLDADGTIDADYRGEVKVGLRNVSLWPRRVRAGDRIAQLKVVRCCMEAPCEAHTLTSTERGAGGFGSTGR